MVYRHIYWGLLNTSPRFCSAEKYSQQYLVQITTPNRYQTADEAREDDMEYCFQVLSDKPLLSGYSKGLKAEDLCREGKCTSCAFHDRIRQEDWPRYRLIRLKETDKIMEGLKPGFLSNSKAEGRKWRKLFPTYGLYPVKKIAYSIVALPDVVEGEADDHSGK